MEKGKERNTNEFKIERKYMMDRIVEKREHANTHTHSHEHTKSNAYLILLKLI